MNNEEKILTLLEQLNGTVNVMQADIVEMKGDIAVLKDDVAGLKDDVAVLKDDVAGLKDDVAGLKDDVAGLKESQAVMQADIAGLKGDVAELKAGQKTMEDRLERTIREIGTTMVEVVDELGGRIDAMCSEFSSMERVTKQNCYDLAALRASGMARRKEN